MNNKNGFTFIEVLIGLGLFMIIFLSVSVLHLFALQYSREALMRTIAVQQLQSITQMRIVDMHQFYTIWNLDNHKLLPDGRGEIEGVGNHLVFRIYWRSVLPNRWHCRLRAIPHYACMEMEVLP
jgi:type II secretory pathway pseudopilin PulG